MTQEELLLKDLCSRLPYGVIVKDRNGIHELTVGNTEFTDLFSGKCNIKPYLRPMSDMTTDEFSYLASVMNYKIDHSLDLDAFYKGVIMGRWIDSKLGILIDFYNSHYFDWRGLIAKGLALEAPEGMYNF